MTARNKRVYARASTLLPAKVRRLRPAEREGLACRIVTGGIVIDDAPPPRVDDEKLQMWLSMLNAKLDYLIRLAPARQEEAVHAKIEPLNLSAGGMSLVTDEHFTPGERVEIRIVMQAYPPKVLYLYGEVLRIDAVPEKPGMHLLGIQFEGMSEEVRAEILRFDFRAHRQRMMSRNRERSGPATSGATD
ncbi:MAG: PilZ domain-containing protein [Thermodesulfobacteriota bacterium]